MSTFILAEDLLEIKAALWIPQQHNFGPILRSQNQLTGKFELSFAVAELCGSKR